VRTTRERIGVLLCALALSAGAPQVVSGQSLSFAQAGTIAGPVDRVKAQGDILYVVANKSLTIYDVSDPAAPKRVGAHTFVEQVWGFRVIGSRLYVATGHSGLAILDVSNPAAPTPVSQFKTPGQAKNVSIAGTLALVANHMSGIDVVDISDSARPKLVGSAYLDGYARDVATVGSMAVAVDNPSGVYVFDTAKPDPLEPVTSVQTATSPQQVEIVELPGGRKLAALAANEPYDPLSTLRARAGEKPRPGSMQVFDVSDPASPVLTGSHPTSGNGRRLAVKGSLVYVADGPDGLRVLDVSTPSKVTLVASYPTTMPARDVAVSDSLVFVVLGPLRTGSAPKEDGDVLILRQTSK
jgi:hypothetical protein